MDSKIFYKYLKNISFLICVGLIFEELFYLSKFVFNYNYYYNYGNSLKNINGNDNIEYETARFQVANNAYRMKLENDIYYNSNHIKLIYYLSTFYLLLIIFLFALLFYNTFIFVI